MNRAIIVSVCSEKTEFVEQVVRTAGFGCAAVISGGSELRRIIKSEAAPELIVIISPLPNEFGSDLAEIAAEETSAGIILLCTVDIAEELSDRLSHCGAVVLSMPVSRETLTESIHKVTEGYAELKESSDVLNRIDDIRLINKAKSVLMKYLKFTEPQAHRYIEKQAMNTRCTRREAAEHIINNYK